MLTLAALNYQEFFVSLQRHKIIQHFFSIFFFSERKLVPSGRNLLHAAIVCRHLSVHVCVAKQRNL